MGQIVRIAPETSQSELWGKQFPMTPAFCEKEPFLLGREDFFASLKIQFVPGPPQPAFLIEY